MTLSLMFLRCLFSLEPKTCGSFRLTLRLEAVIQILEKSGLIICFSSLRHDALLFYRCLGVLRGMGQSVLWLDISWTGKIASSEFIIIKEKSIGLERSNCKVVPIFYVTKDAEQCEYNSSFVVNNSASKPTSFVDLVLRKSRISIHSIVLKSTNHTLSPRAKVVESAWTSILTSSSRPCPTFAPHAV
jgi:hypothetical protein